MTTADGRASPRFKWTRVGVMINETSEFRPLLGIGASRDGGIILSPGDYVQSPEWEYGLASLPGRYPRPRPGRVLRNTVKRIDAAPKLHYHRSGFVSVDLSRQAPKRHVTATPLDRLRGVQFFSYSVSHPELLPMADGYRKGDTYVVAHGGLPTRVVVAGFVYRSSQLPPDAQLSGTVGPRGFVQNDVAVPVTDLAGHGLDLVLAYRFQLQPAPRTAPTDRASAVLFAMDGAALLGGTTRIVGLWTPDHGTPDIQMCPPGDAPFASRAPADVVASRRDISRITRAKGGGVTSDEPIGPQPA